MALHHLFKGDRTTLTLIELYLKRKHILQYFYSNEEHQKVQLNKWDIFPFSDRIF